MLKKIIAGLIIGAGIVGGSVIAMEAIDRTEDTAQIVETTVNSETDEMTTEELALYSELVALLGEHVTRKDYLGNPVKKVLEINIDDNEIVIKIASEDNVKMHIHTEIIRILRQIRFDRNLRIYHTLQVSNNDDKPEFIVHSVLIKKVFFKDGINWEYITLHDIESHFSEYRSWTGLVVEETNKKTVNTSNDEDYEELDLSTFVQVINNEIIVRNDLVAEKVTHPIQRVEILREVNGVFVNKLNKLSNIYKLIKVTTYNEYGQITTLYFQYNDDGTVNISP